MMGSNFESYIETIEDFDVEYDKFINRAKNNEINGDKLMAIYEDTTGLFDNTIYGSYIDCYLNFKSELFKI